MTGSPSGKDLRENRPGAWPRKGRSPKYGVTVASVSRQRAALSSRRKWVEPRETSRPRWREVVVCMAEDWG